MTPYTVHISFLATGSPTDLELEDLMRSFTDTLDDPSIIGIDDEWVSADYKIPSYVVELFDDNDQRVWRFASMPAGDNFVESYHSLHYVQMRQQPPKQRTVVERIKLFAIGIRNFYMG